MLFVPWDDVNVSTIRDYISAVDFSDPYDNIRFHFFVFFMVVLETALEPSFFFM